MAMSKPSAVWIVQQYNEGLMSDPEVRFLMGAVVQDAQNETIDTAASCAKLRELAATRDFGAQRRKIIAFLNALWLSDCHYLPPPFWWEMRYRLLKLLHVSIVLEALNLRSFGVTRPNARDIPQAIVHLRDYIARECTDAKLDNVARAFDAASKRNAVWLTEYFQCF